MKRSFLLFSLALFFLDLNAQVSKQVIVEHFTNSRCGICASKNPGFYNNLFSKGNILHVSIHPSAPYSNCLLHQHNPAENDGRTNYYGVYGGTPRLVINGTVIPSNASYSSSTLFDPYLNQTAAFSLNLKEVRYGKDSIRAELSIKKVSASSLIQARLFMAYAEDTVFYSSPNGEKQHYDVFRKAFTGVTGDLINLPANVGDSILVKRTINYNNVWKQEQMSAYAILNDASNKAVIQSGKTSSVENGGLTAIDEPFADRSSLELAPNPAAGKTRVLHPGTLLELYSLNGQLLRSLPVQPGTDYIDLDLNGLAPGTYLVRSGRAQKILLVKE